MRNQESKHKDLETVKGWLALARENNNKLAIQILEKFFPELNESEDERIRKGLIEHLKELKEQSVEGSHLKRPEHYDAWLAWLEKQGEQKSANKVEPRFEVGDCIRYRGDNYKIKDIETTKHGFIYNVAVIGKPSDPEEVKTAIGIAAEKDMVKIEQPAWSEEDLMIQDAIHWIREFQQSNRCKDENDMQNSVTCENWLKSIKFQKHWKPSEEQMNALETAIRCRTMPWEQLGTLYNDLKKLIC